MSVDVLPPGESAADELFPTDAFEALHTALQKATNPATKYLSVREITFQKVGRVVLCSFSWKDCGVRHQVTVRMPTAKARAVNARLNALVGK